MVDDEYPGRHHKIYALCHHNLFIHQALLSCMKQPAFTMDVDDGDNEDMHEVVWDDDSEMMSAAVLIVVNNNIAIMNLMMLARQEQEDQDRMQMINDLMTPNQDYRRQPRQAQKLVYFVIVKLFGAFKGIFSVFQVI